MRQRKKTQRAVVSLLCVIAITPIAVLASSHLDGKQASIQADLQRQRSELTLLSNDRHRLKIYAKRLSRDVHLKSIVKQSIQMNAQWQTPMQQVRLRLMDGLAGLDVSGQNQSSVSLDWLEVQESREQNQSEVQSLWLQAEVISVPYAIGLIHSIKAFAKPYPLQTQGCSYQLIEQSHKVKVRCRLRLEAWSLPDVKHLEDSNGKLTDVAPKYIQTAGHSAVCCSTNSALRHWRIFKAKPKNNKPPESKFVSSSALIVKSKKLQEKERISKAVITGPAGRLVIHAPSK